jgi:uncharacterized protein
MPDGIVIADSTCLIGLAKIGRLSLLQALFGRITVAKSVWDEVVEQGAGRAGSLEMSEATWIDVRAAHDALAFSALRLTLGAGESESIILAKEQSARLLVLDDAKARRVALELGLPIAGTVALLKRAEEKGLIPSAPAAMEELVQAGFHLY